jgi:MFS-type transporter involved in bile tolerance (Atg22 family)
MRYQWNKQHEVPAEVDDEKQQDIKENMKTKEIKEKGYIVYSDTDKYNFILHMITKVPRFVAPVARRYRIHPKTAQRWWEEYQQDPEQFF